METIKVNMTPCEDVQTIHASQNDNEAREWGFELHNNGEKIDSSSISDQLVFKAYEGGTEQILPENGSTPTTSPFKGDIKYPQGLLSDQEFLYRESPTESDGLAKITDIKGNTLNWNQLVQNGNFDVIGNWTRRYVGSISVADNILTYTNNSGQTINNWQTEVQTPTFSIPANHVFYCHYDIKPEGYAGSSYHIAKSSSGNIAINFSPTSVPQNVWTRMTFLGSFDKEITNLFIRMIGVSNDNGSTSQMKNFMIVDLTKMGLDIINPSEFTSLFSLPYYDYNQGTLLSFNGNGIKTVGKNQVANVVKGYFNNQSSTITINNGGESFVFYAWQDKTYYASSSIALNRNVIAQCDTPDLVNGSPIYNPVNFGNTTEKKWTATWTGWTVWYVYNDNNDNVHNSAQVEIGTTATDYEPYTESVASLPIQQYFPNGMKSTGDVHDEITETKAITRIGAVDLGSLTWTKQSPTTGNFYRANISGRAYGANATGGLCAKYEWVLNGTTSALAEQLQNKQMGYQTTNAYVWIRDDDYNDATSFKESLQGQYLYFELATYEETSFTTASLVTENTEIPLSNEDGVLIGKCTEELSAEPGFHDAKIKLSDSDGDVYSNKIQLHIERSPQ